MSTIGVVPPRISTGGLADGDSKLALGRWSSGILTSGCGISTIVAFSGTGADRRFSPSRSS
jgi:hypothetical protein